MTNASADNVWVFLHQMSYCKSTYEPKYFNSSTWYFIYFNSLAVTISEMESSHQ